MRIIVSAPKLFPLPSGSAVVSVYTYVLVSSVGVSSDRSELHLSHATWHRRCSQRPARLCSLDRPAADVHAALAAGTDPAALAALFQHDQLRAALSTDPSHALAPFAEAVHPLGAPPFPPSYKYVPGTRGEYDARRTPSWTDRVLWRCNYAHALPGGGGAEGGGGGGDDEGGGCVPVAQTRYAAVAAAARSDHKPVVASFAIALKHSAPLAADGAVDAVSAYLGGMATGGSGRRKWLGVKQRARGTALAAASVVPFATAPLRLNAAAL